VAVDVGGSGLRLQITYAAHPGPVRTAPGARVGTTGIDVDALVSSARSLLDSSVPRQAAQGAAPAVVVWSMRGLLFLADRAGVLERVAAGLGGRDTIVVSDAVAGLVGAMGQVRPGAVVAAGTGAVAFGTDFTAHWNRVDGWGHVLGDVGSAAWVGLEALRAALRAVDGFDGGSAPLLEAAVDLLGPPESWPRLVMTSPDAPERLASLAPAVTTLAADDAVADQICRRAGSALAESLLRAACGLTGPEPVLTASGGLLGAAPIRAALDERLAAAGRARVPSLGTALDGATTLGRHLLTSGSVPTHERYLLHRSVGG
jgi:N-acetylglucosamine kinase-like BadF-type ATPase